MKKVFRILALCLMLVMIPAAAFAVDSVLTNDINGRTFMVGEWAEFSFTTVANDDFGTYINAYSAFDKPEAIAALDYYEVATGTWVPLSHDPSTLGPVGGFPLTDATMNFRVKFNTAGNYTFSAFVFDASNIEEVLCSTTASFTVVAPSVPTGDATNVAMLIGMMLVSGAAVVMFMRKKVTGR